METPLASKRLVQLCPYGIITLNPETQQYQGFAGLALFFFIPIPSKKGAEFASVKL